jgi:hypothetical protein
MDGSGAAVISASVSPKILGEDWSTIADEGETWSDIAAGTETWTEQTATGSWSVIAAGAETWADQTGNTRTWLNQ